MSKHRWSIEQKRQHVAAWRASGLTRQQYCELEPVNDIPFKSLRECQRMSQKLSVGLMNPPFFPFRLRQHCRLILHRPPRTGRLHPAATGYHKRTALHILTETGTGQELMQPVLHTQF